MPSPLEGLRSFIDQLPEILQPVVIAVLGMIPYVEGEGSAAIGIILGMNPIIAALAGAGGNILSVIAVVALSSRVRQSVLARRAARAPIAAGGGEIAPAVHEPEKENRRSKGRRRINGWLVRFGVPGASILAPWVLPTQLTAALFVASGVKKSWVILWQAVSIVLWTGLVAAAALGLLTLLGW